MAEPSDATSQLRAALRRATSDPAVRLLVRGQAASGKSALLAAIRARVGAGALVVDDAHARSDRELADLISAVENFSGSVIVATEPRPANVLLRTLTSTFAHRGTVLELARLTVDDVARLAPNSDSAHLVKITGGSLGGVLAAVDSTANNDVAVATWLRGRLRRAAPEVLATLVIAAAGAGLDPADVADLVGVSADVAVECVDRVRASGLLTDADDLLPSVAEPLRGVVGARRMSDLHARLFDSLRSAQTLTPAVASRLAHLGVRHPQLAAYLCEQATTTAPNVAVSLYAAAAAAGADVDVRHANAAVLAGDIDTAQALANKVVDAAESSPADVGAAVRVLGTCWAERGRLDRSADLYAWLGPERIGSDAGLATAVLYAVGRPADAARFAALPPAGPPTEHATAVAALGDAIAQSMAAPAGAPVNSLVRLAAGIGSATLATALDPVVVAATLAMHNGEVGRAATLLARAPDSTTRRLLRAWTALLSGDDDAARAGIADVTGTALGNRDAVLAHGIRVGLARRGGDHGELLTVWTAAQQVLDEITVDLFTLLPLGELWLGGVRAGDALRIQHLIDDATTLLNRLGGPQAWANTFHWYGIQAALLADQPAAFVPHARALGRAAEHPAGDRYGTALAAAGRTWLRVLRGEAEADEIERAARSLDTIGLPWDGARLASEGALRAADTGAATTLLQVARGLRQRTSAPTFDAQPIRSQSGPLSEREAEVAELVVLGLTYREVGSRLYISAKTVEHHVARIRRRLGAGSRSELLSMLRALGYGDPGRSVGL